MSIPLHIQMLWAAKAHGIPCQTRGLWTIANQTVPQPGFWDSHHHTKQALWQEPGEYTGLWHLTEATLHQPPGECVMHDRLCELNTHLNFMLRAHGHVLITGLGLGCVVRGTLLNPKVESITVVERDKDIIQMVWPHMPQDPRLTLEHSCAIEFCKKTDRRFDTAWHDLWNNADKGEPHLAVIHANTIANLAGKVKQQGAWAFPRRFKRLWHPTVTIK